MNNKKHFSQIDFIRTFCAFAIIIYHYSCEAKTIFKPSHIFANGDIGSVIVTVFFIVSGFVLYHSNNVINSLKQFYLKRFKSIFPSFYICWLIFYLLNVIKVRTPFYAGSPIKFIFTLIGMDGYLSQRIVTYYTVGEWFLGALIFTYLLYPLLLKGLKKNDKLVLILLLAATIVINVFNIPTISPGFPGIVESCLKVYIGMMIYKYKELLNNNIFLLCCVIVVVIYSFVSISFLNVLFALLYSIGIFVILFRLGAILTKSKITSGIFKELGSLTYPIFLCHHQLLLMLLGIFTPNSIISAILFVIITIILCIVFAKIIQIITKLIINKLETVR